MKKLPKLPTKLATQFGAIPVEMKDAEWAEKREAFGEFEPITRRVFIAKDTALATRWQTFWHEVAEVAVFDSGVAQSLSHKQKEAMCDAIGAQLTTMMLAGQLKVSAAWEKE